VATAQNGHGRESESLVVVGNGMVGHRFCEAVHGADTARRFQVVCLGEEPRPAYDRVHLSEYFGGRTADALALADRHWYAERGITLHLSERVVAIDREASEVVTASGQRVRYDTLVLATGSAPFVPPLPGIDRPGGFVYRTVEDLEAIEAWGRRVRRAAVIGGGLLGLEAAKAARDVGLETHVVEFAPRLMPRQLDAGGGAMLRRAIEGLGVRVMVDARTTEVLGTPAVSGLRFETGDDLPVEMLIVSAGIRPRDELARASGLEVGPRGGVVVDDRLCTSDPHIHAIGEVALHGGTIYGLVGPGYEMAAVLAANLTGGDRRFTGADMSTRLKLMGVDVASVGDPFAGGDEAPTVVVEDRQAGVYQKLVLTADGRRLAGGVLVGDVGAYPALLAKVRERSEVPERAASLLLGDAGPVANGASDGEKVCSCNNVSRGEIRTAIAGRELTTVGGVKACTGAGTGCGGCLATVEQILACELLRKGRAVDRNLCEHFAHTRQELFQIVKIRRLRAFEELIRAAGRGDGCEICKPAAASIFAGTWNDPILDQPTIQDTNDRFLANIQRGGTYSVIPRIPGGEITPEQLIVLGQVAKRYDLYCKITGGQRVDLLGARVDQLPDIWEELVAAGFESGHAYGKALRTVKSCVGTTWCRYGVQDSTGFAIRLEERYRGIRAPHKVKAAVSGCIRECAEAQGKDFGVIATEKGWNLYVGGNGGSNPRHADLLASDLDEETVVRYVDRFLMYYIHTADRLQRTARWIEAMDGGIEYLRSVIIDDSLGVCAQLERDMAALVDSYECEWAAVVRDPVRRAAFRHYVNSTDTDETLAFVRERGQKRPADWPVPVTADDPAIAEASAGAKGEEWVRLATVHDVPRDGGAAARYGDSQIAIFNFASRGEWYATQNVCPHRRDMVLARGILGDQSGVPKVACPVHKKIFSLATGAGLSDGSFRIRTFPVEVRGEEVWVRLPPAAFLERTLPRRPAPEAQQSPCATCARAC